MADHVTPRDDQSDTGDTSTLTRPSPSGRWGVPSRTPTCSFDEEYGDKIIDWARWYYPAGGKTPTELVKEMIDLAHWQAERDQQRAETPAERVQRLAARK